MAHPSFFLTLCSLFTNERFAQNNLLHLINKKRSMPWWSKSTQKRAFIGKNCKNVKIKYRLWSLKFLLGANILVFLKNVLLVPSADIHIGLLPSSHFFFHTRVAIQIWGLYVKEHTPIIVHIILSRHDNDQ